MKVIVLLTCWVFATLTEVSSCPDDWIGHGNSCYMFIGSRKTWAEATIDCASKGSTLAKVETAEANLFLRGYLKVYSDLGGNITTWVGGNDLKSPGVWEWSPSGEPMSFTDWTPGKPEGHKTNNCLQLDRKHDFHWVDAPCTDHLSFMCERPLIPTQS